MLRRFVIWLRMRYSYHSKYLNPKYYYYKHIYRKKILESGYFKCSDTTDFEVHIITSGKDFLDALWCAKTFFYHSRLNPVLVVHSDGSLSSRQIQIIHEHFDGSRVISKAIADAEMNSFLSEYPHIQKFRNRSDFYCAMKIFDILKYSRQNYLLLLDSDILFFKKPDLIIQNIEQKKLFFNSDYQNAYTPFALEYFKANDIEILPKINAGLIFMNKVLYIKHLKLMDDYFREALLFKVRCNVNRHEQTLNAMLLTLGGALRLSSNYQISDKPLTSKTISHHFVNDGNRDRMYLKGLKKLRNEGFLYKI